eukprot:3643073-Rhodomonas_salina.3
MATNVKMQEELVEFSQLINARYETPRTQMQKHTTHNVVFLCDVLVLPQHLSLEMNMQSPRSSGTNRALSGNCPPIVLRTRYALYGTYISFAATLVLYAFATRRPRPTRSIRDVRAGIADIGIVLGARYAMSGTDMAYAVLPGAWAVPTQL